MTEKVAGVGEITRRDLLERAGKLTVGGLMLSAGLRPALAFAESLAGGTVVEASQADPTTVNPRVGQD